VNKLQCLSTVKEQFNPKNKNHMSMVRDFFRDSKWGQYGCPFMLEWPYEDIPYKLKTKIVENTLKLVDTL
jgi:hypothetical protein